MAPLGTALTIYQLERSWKVCENPIILFDGDEAGQKAAARAANLALNNLKPDFSLRICILPLDTDPDDFIKQNGKCVIKPLYGNGGESIFLLDKQDENYNQILERFIDQLKEPFIIQKFLPEIKHGDKRIILVNGEPIAALRRIPKNNEIRSNIHVGGNCEAVKISRQDLNICSEIFKIRKNIIWWY